MPIGDLGKVAEDILPCDTTCCRSTEILAANISTYNACVSCKAKVDVVGLPIARCTKCGMEQLVAKCEQQHSARLFLSQVAADPIAVSAFTKVLLDITKGKTINTPNLLQADPFSATIQSKTVISISRQP